MLAALRSPWASSSRCSCDLLALFRLDQRRTATKRAAKHTDNKKDSGGRALGVKRHEGHLVKENEILVRQVGANIWPGQNCSMSRDFTITAKQPGYVRFYTDKRFAGQTSLTRVNMRKYCGIVFHPSERLPRDETSRGRERRLGLVEMNGLREYLSKPQEALPAARPPAQVDPDLEAVAAIIAGQTHKDGSTKAPLERKALGLSPFSKRRPLSQRLAFTPPKDGRFWRDPSVV